MQLVPCRNIGLSPGIIRNSMQYKSMIERNAVLERVINIARTLQGEMGRGTDRPLTEQQLADCSAKCR